jgi:hypothetical protein
VIIKTFISFVALMMTVGCATKSPPLIVAYGHLVGQHDEIELRIARYEVSEIQRGHLPTNVVEVVFWRKTQTSELPSKALLLLSRPLAPAIWYAVGEDAARGILLDTPDARIRVASLADDRILDNPKSDWLPRADAERIIADRLRAEGLDVTRMRLGLRRGEFGWRASVSFPDAQGRIPVGGESYLGVRDSGDILYWSKGL